MVSYRGLLAVPRGCRSDSMDTFPAFQRTYANFLVIYGVAILVAGPLFGILALEIKDTMKRIGQAWYWTVGGVVTISMIPAAMAGILIADPRLSLSDHRAQAMLGLQIGYLALAAGGIGLAVQSRLQSKRKS
jgi:hypothetical protein